MQLPLFQPTPATVYDPPPRREPLHYVPVYRVQLVHEAAISIPLPQLRTSQDSANLFRRSSGTGRQRTLPGGPPGP
jgi:hypothetical protein